MKIREVSAAQMDACARVIRESFATVAREFALTRENCPTNGAFLERERLVLDRGKGKRLFALHVERDMVGFMELAQQAGGAFELEKLAVLPEFRHRGYGHALLDFAAARVWEWGGQKITIGIIEENARLKQWYEAYGFHSIGTKQFSHLPFTVGFMELNVTKQA